MPTRSTTAGNAPALHTTNLHLPLVRRGKVRDVYRLPPANNQPPDHAPLLIVATDRISAFDVVMRTPIPTKGALLTAVSRHWFDFVHRLGIAPTQTLGWDVDPAWNLPHDQAQALAGRVCVARPAHVLPIECVVRGYIDGSGWREYQDTGEICGVQLPNNLQRGDKLPGPVFTPATKAEDGEHDENITFEEACDTAGEAVIRRARDISIAIYQHAHTHCEQRGIILADTKFEFGFPLDADDRSPDALMLIDEVLTPDSSRYWPADTWKPGGPQPSFDKQFVREHLQHLADAGGWDKTPDADGLGPELPPEVVRGTLDRYREALDRLWGGTPGA